MVKMFHSVSQCRTDLSHIRTPTLHIPQSEGGRKQIDRERKRERYVNIEMCSIVTSDSSDLLSLSRSHIVFLVAWVGAHTHTHILYVPGILYKICK